MTSARCQFAHRANFIAINRWFNVGPTPEAQQALQYANVMPTILFQVSRWANIIIGRHYLWAQSININSL